MDAESDVAEAVAAGHILPESAVRDAPIGTVGCAAAKIPVSGDTGFGDAEVEAVDVDFVKDGGEVFTKALSAVCVPATLHESLQNMRSKVKAAFEATGREMKREGGLALLQGDNKALAEKLFSDLAEYGLFVVPGGELESWLKLLECTGHGPNWLIQVFGKMGSDPLDVNYVKPTTGDVWDFIRGIQKWVNDPRRKGMAE